MAEMPLVSVLTPVYNGADFIAACIESVLEQTYGNFEYIIVNNCSKDATLQIARDYAARDPRIRVHDNTEFLGVIANHNLAFSLMSPASKYCKVVSADDWLEPRCVEDMVALAEQHPRVTLVGCYMLAGKQIMNMGLTLDQRVISGREICRRTLLGGPYVFGSPTSLLYRADVVRGSAAFYPTPNPHSDTTACYRTLQDSDFGFVHQILCHARIHSESQTSRSIRYGTIRRAMMADLIRFGPVYLKPEELSRRRAHLMKYYRRWLGGAVIRNRRDPEFWQLQKTELAEVGIRVGWTSVVRGWLARAGSAVAAPQETVTKIRAALGSGAAIEARYYEE